MLQLISAMGMGSAFGTFLHKSRVSDPYFIRSQMIFEDNTMMMVFLSAAGMSSVVLSSLQLMKSPFFHPRISPVNLYKNMLGGVILGLGMTIGGGCPGTILANLGSGYKASFFAVLGGLTGSFIFAQAHQKIEKVMPRSKQDGKTAFIKRKNHWKLGYPFAVACFAGAMAISKFLYWNKTNERGSWMQRESWNPIIAGIGIGLIQLPMLMFTKSMLGASKPYVSFHGFNPAVKNLKVIKKNQYIQSLVNKDFSKFKLCLNGGLILGGFLSAYFSGKLAKNLNTSLTVEEAIQSFVGGFFLLFGARMAGGCNSGHGISGLPSFSISSYITTASIFAGAIGLRVLLRKFYN